MTDTATADLLEPDLLQPVPYGYCHCRCGGRTSIAKGTDSRRGWIKGQPVRFILGHSRIDRRDCSERFWEQVDKNGPIVRPELGPCWLWIGYRDQDGYGVSRVNGRRRATHVALELAGYFILFKGLEALHRCDNCQCIRPDHLKIDTKPANIADKVAKGRQARVDRPGTTGRARARWAPCTDWKSPSRAQAPPAAHRASRRRHGRGCGLWACPSTRASGLSPSTRGSRPYRRYSSWRSCSSCRPRPSRSGTKIHPANSCANTSSTRTVFQCIMCLPSIDKGLRLSPALATLSAVILAPRPSGFVTLLRPFRWATFLPPLPPVGLPAWSGFTPPVFPGRWRDPVVLDRNHQDWPRNEIGRDENPRTAVPATDVPAAVGKHVVFARVEKVVGAHAGSVHDRSRRHRHQQRGGRKIDPDSHTDLGMAQARQAE